MPIDLIKTCISPLLKYLMIRLVSRTLYLIHVPAIHSPMQLYFIQYKERDLLEGIFKFWRNKDEKTFEISKYW